MILVGCQYDFECGFQYDYENFGGASTFRSNVQNPENVKIQTNGPSENFGGTSNFRSNVQNPEKHSNSKKTGHPKISATPPQNHMKTVQNHMKTI